MGWLSIGGLIVFAFLVNQCTSKSGPAPADRLATDAQQAIATAVQKQSPPPIEPLSRPAVGRGLAHARLAASEGLAGAMIYSQNCYDVLGRTFSWAKLDSCGAFDAEAVLTADDEDATNQGTEAAWFQSEAAAGRFLKTANAARESSDEADARWSELQQRVARRHKAKTGVLPTASPSETESTTSPGAGSPEELDG